jgi:hypothetical protein
MTFRRSAARGAFSKHRITPLRLLVAAFAATATLSFADIASAQSITLPQENSLTRLDRDGKEVRKRPLNQSPEAVNLDDCLSDQQISFRLNMAGYEVNASVEAWASVSGQDCKQQTARGGGVQTCWRVYDSNIPLQPTVDVNIPVRKIMSGAPPFRPVEPDPSENACGKVDLANIGIQFLYFPPGDKATASVAKNVAITVDTVGPPPPSGVRTLPGDHKIHIRWNQISGGGGDGDASTGSSGGLVDLTGMEAYCEPASGGASTTTTTQNPPVCHDEPVDASADDSGDASTDAATTVQVCEDGGTSTTSTPAPKCSSPNFTKNDGGVLFPDPEFRNKYKCGSITGNIGTQLEASEIGGNPLENDKEYAIVVANVDRYGNIGELSPVLCETPEVTTDFWDNYKGSGGEGGGGCSTNGSSVPLGSVSVLTLIVATAGSSLLRRRSVRSRRALASGTRADSKTGDRR